MKEEYVERKECKSYYPSQLRLVNVSTLRDTFSIVATINSPNYLVASLEVKEVLA